MSDEQEPLRMTAMEASLRQRIQDLEMENERLRGETRHGQSQSREASECLDLALAVASDLDGPQASGANAILMALRDRVRLHRRALAEKVKEVA